MLKDIQSCLQVPDILFHKIYIISTPHKLQMSDSGLLQPIQGAEPTTCRTAEIAIGIIHPFLIIFFRFICAMLIIRIFHCALHP